MKSKITELIKKIESLKGTLKNELLIERKKFRDKYGFYVKKGKVIFERQIVLRHKKLKENIFKYIFFPTKLRHLLSAPFIYSMIIPAVILDVFLTIFHGVCFKLYGIPRVKRGDYIVFDKRFLGYLNVLEKLHCIYCSYVNGLFAYAREIAGRTERYWCPVKHAAKHVEGLHEYYGEFADFGDPDGFKGTIHKFDNKHLK